MFMTEDKYRSQPHCVALPAGARIGTCGETGLPIPATAGSTAPKRTGFERKFTIFSGDAELAAHLMIPSGAAGAVVVADSGESGRRHPWDRLAAALNQAGLGTLAVGLLMPQEILSYGKRSDVQALAGRLTGVTRWLIRHPAARGLPVGYFGASAAAAAALWAAAAEPRVPVAAIVCQDGRPDLAWPQLGFVRSPTLLIVNGQDEVILSINRRARQQLSCQSDLTVIPAAARLPGEPRAQEQTARPTAGWLTRHLMPEAEARSGPSTASVHGE